VKFTPAWHSGGESHPLGSGFVLSLLTDIFGPDWRFELITLGCACLLLIAAFLVVFL
jgi:hypothetical protein